MITLISSFPSFTSFPQSFPRRNPLHSVHSRPPIFVHIPHQTIPLTALLFNSGPLRSYLNRTSEIRPRTWRLPPRLFQEHTRDGTSNQWLEAWSRVEVSGECARKEGSGADETVCWEYWSDRAGYVESFPYVIEDGGSDSN